MFYIGTSGWQYAHWRRTFYPRGTPDDLAYYAARFPTVELNGTFYRLPEQRTFRDWARRTPGGYVFALKASRFLTHLRRLRQPRRTVRRMLARARGLDVKLGPILLQLPPEFAPDLDRLAETLDALAGHRVAVEFRDPRWFQGDTRHLLERHDAALCLADRGSRLITPPWRTADWGYIRFHGGRGRPAGAYGRGSLESRARLLSDLFGARPDVFAYFNNDGHGCATRDARAFAGIARRAGLRPLEVAQVRNQRRAVEQRERSSGHGRKAS